MSVEVRLLYFASLRDAAGLPDETVITDAVALSDLYRDRARQHGFELPIERVRVAVDAEFVAWTDAPRAGSEVAFVPPVSGG